MTVPARILWPIQISRFRIAPDMLGRRLSLGTHNGLRLRLELPSSFDNPGGTTGPSLMDAHAYLSASVDAQPTVITVDRLRLRADFPIDLDYLATVKPGYQATAAQWAEVQQLIESATATAQHVLTTFFDLVAARHGYYSLIIESGPLSTYYDLHVGTPPNPVNFGSPPVVFNVHAGDRGLTFQQARRLQRLIRRGEQPPLAWQQYVEAYHRLYLADDPKPAIIAAVTAIEIGLKDAMRKKSGGSKTVELLLRGERLKELMGEVAKPVLGESYADADKTNYDLIVALINQRNSLVHRGDLPSVEALKRQLPAVQALLLWLDSK